MIFLMMCSVLINSSSINTIVFQVGQTNLVLNNSDWSKGIVISDDSTGWNDAPSNTPCIAIDNNNEIIYVAWSENTDGEWGSDSEILIVNHTASGWSNVTVVADTVGFISRDPDMAIDKNDNLHIVWVDDENDPGGADWEIFYANYTGGTWSNQIEISDDGSDWNDDGSFDPSIAVDKNGNVHVVWYDETDGEWGTDMEIMYANYSAAQGWMNATCISDVYGWNVGDSYRPKIAADNNSIIHVVWHDLTDGEWGADTEIMYVNSTGGIWSNATVISDDATGWNNDHSYRPDIATDNNSMVHVVWYDNTDGEWGTDSDIMYSNYTAGIWANATVISDDATGWNVGNSFYPKITIDEKGVLHVVWQDNTAGSWGTDSEIMYTKYNKTSGTSWTKATVISDDNTRWNNLGSNDPSIAVDNNSIAHVVWNDDTSGWWGTDDEIMYSNSNYTAVPGGDGVNILPILFVISSEPDSSALYVGLVIVIVVIIAVVIVVVIKMRQEK